MELSVGMSRREVGRASPGSPGVRVWCLQAAVQMHMWSMHPSECTRACVCVCVVYGARTRPTSRFALLTL